MSSKEDSKIAIWVDNVGKTFQPQSSSKTVKEGFVGLGRMLSGKKKLSHHKGDYIALKDVNFDVKKGEFFGIVGRNGSGKSTLLKILAGVYTPTKGSVQINGKLTPFIELGVGFNPELSGHDNVFLNGALLGFTRKQMEAMYDDIVDFAELHDFMETKLKNYSSGMQVRLAFSVAIRADSDILLIDEVLAVGDAAFQTKCFDYFHKLRDTHRTVVFVSHDRSSLERFCSRALLVDKGRVVSIGSIGEILEGYDQIVLGQLESSEKDINTDIHDTKAVDIKELYFSDASGNKSNRYRFGESVHAVFRVVVKEEIIDPIVGFTLRVDGLNYPILASNTHMQKNKLGKISKNTELSVTLRLPRSLNNGRYSVEAAVANQDGTIFYASRNTGNVMHIYGGANNFSAISSDEKITIESKIL